MESKKKKAPILVLGGTGHYGRNIVRSLLEKRKVLEFLKQA